MLPDRRQEDKAHPELNCSEHSPNGILLPSSLRECNFDVTWVPFTAAWGVLGIRMEETAFRYGS
jgi:hypothetical protein